MENIKKVADIPANELVEMTPELYQEFCQNGCVPACHYTHKFISIGEKFKLCTVQEHSNDGNMRYGRVNTLDVMLAADTDLKAYLKHHKNTIHDMELLKAKDRSEGRTGCFRINGQIIN